MKKETLPQKLFCLLWIFIGAVICALGIQLTLISGAGVDPLTMFEEGLANRTGITVGNSALLVNVSTLVIGFFLVRRVLGWGSVIASFAIGPAIDFWANLLETVGVGAPQSLVTILLVDILGVAIIGLGIAFYMVPDYGVGGMDCIMIYLSEKLNKEIGITRVAMDCTWGVIGLMLGGTLGLGTLIGAVGIGMSIQFFYKLFCKIFIK